MRSTPIDISSRSPWNVHRAVVVPSTRPISNCRRPCTLSTTSSTVPSRTESPFNIRRVDHSCSRMVWCRSTRACRAEDFPDAFEPDRSVRGPRGRSSVSKHLKYRNSVFSNIEPPRKLLAHDLEAVPHLLGAIDPVCDRVNEILVGHELVEAGAQFVRAGLDLAF